MKIMVVGGGGREHAVIQKLKENPRVSEIFCLPGNGGIAADATCVPIKATDIDGITAFAKEHAIDFAVVAPDDPLVLGAVDSLTAVGIPAFGPTAAAAAIEGSKAFSKQLMQKYGIPTAAYQVFASSTEAFAFLDKNTTYPIVVKADGLALGKGVLICEDRVSAICAVKALMEEQVFGKSGSRIVIEEFLTGPEVSVLAFTDGKCVKPMVSSMDHKRAEDGDRGLNTGGMGTVAPNPYYTEEIAKTCMETIFQPTIRAMAAEGRPFKGCLYFGLMLTPDGPKVIEYNCRFGDPEAQVVLPLLESDLLTVMEAVVDEQLAETEVRLKDGAACCVILASGGYPEAYQVGYPITGTDKAAATGARLYFAGVKQTPAGALATSGGRVVGVTAVADDLPQAVLRSYAAAQEIHFKDQHFRTDIGRKALEKLRGEE